MLIVFTSVFTIAADQLNWQKLSQFLLLLFGRQAGSLWQNWYKNGSLCSGLTFNPIDMQNWKFLKVLHSILINSEWPCTEKEKKKCSGKVGEISSQKVLKTACSLSSIYFPGAVDWDGERKQALLSLSGDRGKCKTDKTSTIQRSMWNMDHWMKATPPPYQEFLKPTPEFCSGALLGMPSL